MKIDKLPGLKSTTIKELLPGDCFTYFDTRSVVLMKTSDKEANNVISLCNGNLSTIHEDTKVIPLPNARVAFSEETETEPNSSTEKEKKEWYEYTFKEIKINYCRQAFGCLNCPISSACSGYMRIDDLMEEVEVDDDISNE